MDQSVNSEKIKQLRIAKSWSQEKLALASGLSLRTIQRIENEGVCSLDSRQAIASALEVEPSTLSADAMGSNFNNQNLSCSKYDDINFSGVEFINSNMRNVTISDVNLSQSTFDGVNLSKVEITDANISGMKIFGNLVTDLIERYEKADNAT